MNVEFCLSDGGEVVYTQPIEEIKDIINVITKEGSEVNLYFGEDDFLHGYVYDCMYSVNCEMEENKHVLKIFIDTDYVKSDNRITNEKLDKIIDIIDN